jgi:transposase-like protein
MSTKNKKAAPTGVRYSDAQKKEIVNFVAQYNSAKGRGGQAAASKKFKVTPLTISAWLKGAGAKVAGKKGAPAVAAKPAKQAKSAKPAKQSANSKKGRRYSAEEKQEVVDFVNSWNSAKGRGGQSQAAKKFKLSVLTVSSWLKGAGVAKTKVAAKAVAPAKAAVVPAGLASKVSSLLQIGDQIRKAESELQQLRAKYDALSVSIRSSI